MNRPHSYQEWVHWLELGAGARWIRRLAMALGLVLLSWLIGYKQFHGPKTETTLRQAVVGRQIAEGHGYTTLVNDPQTAAWLQRHGRHWDEPFPELHLAPLYPLTVAAWFKCLPATIRGGMFATAPTPPDGFLPDYLLLVLNVFLFWIAAVLTYALGKILFDRVVGWIAALAVILSAPLWESVVAVDGTPLPMVLLLALVFVAARLIRQPPEGRLPWGGLVGAGALSGALFLTDYATGLALFPLAAFFAVWFAGQRLAAVSVLVLGFLLVAGPWCGYLWSHSGNPVGLAWMEAAQKNDGTAADPAVIRATLGLAAPVLDLSKWMHKGLSGLQANLAGKLWSGGALWFAGFFVASFLYAFRDRGVNAIRALALALLGFLVVANVFLDSGEGERLPAIYGAPLLIVFGVGFCSVLIASSERLTASAVWVFAGLLLLQGLPLANDALEPRRLHFQFPPYYPQLFLSVRDEMWRRAGPSRGWMCDVPAGAAWYSGQRVWNQPATLHDFYAIGADQPMLALVLTPHVLDRPYFSELGHRTEIADERLGDWSAVYASLATGRPAPNFPLAQANKIAENFYVLLDPLTQSARH